MLSDHWTVCRIFCIVFVLLYFQNSLSMQFIVSLLAFLNKLELSREQQVGGDRVMRHCWQASSIYG